MSKHAYHTMGISSMSGSFSCSTTQFTAASTLALPEIENTFFFNKKLKNV